MHVVKTVLLEGRKRVYSVPHNVGYVPVSILIIDTVIQLEGRVVLDVS